MSPPLPKMFLLDSGIIIREIIIIHTFYKALFMTLKRRNNWFNASQETQQYVPASLPHCVRRTRNSSSHSTSRPFDWWRRRRRSSSQSCCPRPPLPPVHTGGGTASRSPACALYTPGPCIGKSTQKEGTDKKKTRQKSSIQVLIRGCDAIFWNIHFPRLLPMSSKHTDTNR